MSAIVEGWITNSSTSVRDRHDLPVGPPRRAACRPRDKVAKLEKMWIKVDKNSFIISVDGMLVWVCALVANAVLVADALSVSACHYQHLARAYSQTASDCA